MTAPTREITVGQYCDSVAELVAQISHKHKIPMGTAFNIVAWGTGHLEAAAAEAEMLKNQLVPPAEVATE